MNSMYDSKVYSNIFLRYKKNKKIIETSGFKKFNSIIMNEQVYNPTETNVKLHFISSLTTEQLN